MHLINRGAELMFFIRLGSIIAWLALLLGAGRLVAGLVVASGSTSEARAAMASRYLGSATSGEAINQGILVVVVAVAFGILVKIARSLTQRY